MHEMGIADAVMRTLDRIVKDENIAGVRSITVELGDLCGVVPRFLADCWEAVTVGTKYEQTILILHPVPATAHCEDCQHTFVVDLDSLRCPSCGSDKLVPLTGRDMTIAEVEVYEV